MTSPIDHSIEHEEWYPALYYAADNASKKAQSTLLRLFVANALLLVLAALLSVISDSSAWLAIVSALLFILSLLCFFVGQHKQYRPIWYQARALAESVKTATWRLVMCADPFADNMKQEHFKDFRSLLGELLDSNKDIGSHLSGIVASKDQVTVAMQDIISMDFDSKRSLYLQKRIDEQRTWYAMKAKDCQSKSSHFFWLLCIAYFIAIALLLVRIGTPEIKWLPIEAFAVIASSLIGWTQLKRFDELASAYGLTAHELGIIKSRYEEVTDAPQLAAFVSDAENAFSREHTQWAARRDH